MSCEQAKVTVCRDELAILLHGQPAEESFASIVNSLPCTLCVFLGNTRPSGSYTSLFVSRIFALKPKKLHINPYDGLPCPFGNVDVFIFTGVFLTP